MSSEWWYLVKHFTIQFNKAETKLQAHWWELTLGVIGGKIDKRKHKDRHKCLLKNASLDYVSLNF